MRQYTVVQGAPAQLVLDRVRTRRDDEGYRVGMWTLVAADGDEIEVGVIRAVADQRAAAIIGDYQSANWPEGVYSLYARFESEQIARGTERATLVVELGNYAPVEPV